MNLISVEKQEKGTALLTIEVSGAEFDAAIQKIYNQNKHYIQIPGFRKGKAPRKLVEKMYGADLFYEDALNDLTPDIITDAVKASGIEMVGYPSVDFATDPGPDGFTLNVVIGVKPVPKIGQYTGLTAPRALVEVTDADVEEEMKPLINRASRTESVERPAENGDTVVIDFEGFKDGVPFEGGKAESYNLELGSGSFIPGFEEQVIGMNAGDERDINVTFPEDYGVETLNGAEVVFKVKVHEVRTTVLPELDDEFAKDVSEFDTLEELREDLRNKVETRGNENADRHYKDAILSKLIDQLDTEIPETMVDFEADQMVENYARRFEGQEFTFDQYLQMMGMTRESLRDQAKAGALREIQANLAYEAIAEAEGYTATDEEVEAEYQKLAEENDMSLQLVKERIPEEDVRNEVRLKKAEDLVYSTAGYEQVNIEDLKPTPEETPAETVGTEAAEDSSAETEVPADADPAGEEAAEDAPAEAEAPAPEE